MNKNNNNALSPKQIVDMLDEFIVGHSHAKKSIAVSLRNRVRRLRVTSDWRNHINSTNLILIGPTGIGKTELVRVASELIYAPIIIVEATKFSEVGYVGSDVSSIIDDLLEKAIYMLTNQIIKQNEKKIAEKIVTILANKIIEDKIEYSGDYEELKKDISNNKLDEIQINVAEDSNPLGDLDIDFAGVKLKNIAPSFFCKSNAKKILIKIARKKYYEAEIDAIRKDKENLKKAIKFMENEGIVVIDEIDKIAGNKKWDGGGAMVSREGVQRCLLPILDGIEIKTKHGFVNTCNILFIGLGSFHEAKYSDLMPEFRGRFPHIIELKSLNKEQLKQIIFKPKYSILNKYKKLLKTENVDLILKESAIDAIADLAVKYNSEYQNIGARAIITIFEYIMKDIMFENYDCKKSKRIEIDSIYVNNKANDVFKELTNSKNYMI